MAYWRTIMKGNLGGGEIWSCSINWGIFGLAPDAPDQPAADGILARLITATTNTNVGADLRLLLSTQGSITGWRVELRSESEHILSVAEGLLPTALTGTNPASKSPQDALVISLRTTTPGPSGRGRFYWPAIGATLGLTFALTSPTPAATVAGARVWLNAIGSAMNAYYASISSVLTVVLAVRSVTNHVNHNVNQLQVGSVLDTQRRRRDSLIETYSSSAYP